MKYGITLLVAFVALSSASLQGQGARQTSKPKSQSTRLKKTDASQTERFVALGVVSIDREKYQRPDGTDLGYRYALVGLPQGGGEPRLYLLSDRGEYDLHTLQYGDTLELSTTEHDAPKLRNESLEARLKALEGEAIDVDLWEVMERTQKAPALDTDGLIARWVVARDRFLQHVTTDSAGYKTFALEDATPLRLSDRLLWQLHSFYVAEHNETVRHSSKAPTH